MVLFTGSENGGGYVDVPEDVLTPSFPEKTFTLATWMRHKPIDDGTDKHHKEHIICKADDHSKSNFHALINLIFIGNSVKNFAMLVMIFICSYNSFQSKTNQKHTFHPTFNL